jgi:hypothetical protein
MPKTFELVLRDGGTVLHTAAARVGDDFERQLLDAYTTYYPEAPGDEALFLAIARGLFEGIMNNIASAERAKQPEVVAPQFAIVELPATEKEEV